MSRIKNKNILRIITLGSKTAKGGFRNERDIVKKFKNWQNDIDTQDWLILMGYKIREIEKVEAVILHGFKTDVQVKITIYLKKAISSENLSIKLVSNKKIVVNPRGFNQVDKRWVNKYVEMWNIPEDVGKLLKIFTGEITPNQNVKLKDKRRILFTEMDKISQNKVINFFSKNKILVVSDILKGRDLMSAEWMMVALNIDNKTRWVLKSINYAMNIFGDGDVRITERGSLKIGKILMQRKGGDRGRPTANMLQFKINPIELFTD